MWEEGIKIYKVWHPRHKDKIFFSTTFRFYSDWSYKSWTWFTSPWNYLIKNSPTPSESVAWYSMSIGYLIFLLLMMLFKLPSAFHILIGLSIMILRMMMCIKPVGIPWYSKFCIMSFTYLIFWILSLFLWLI